MKKAHGSLVQKPERSRSLGKSGQRWINNILKNPRKIWYESWIFLFMTKTRGEVL
jgi:hypothetical protein